MRSILIDNDIYDKIKYKNNNDVNANDVLCILKHPNKKPEEYIINKELLLNNKYFYSLNIYNNTYLYFKNKYSEDDEVNINYNGVPIRNDIYIVKQDIEYKPLSLNREEVIRALNWLVDK